MASLATLKRPEISNEISASPRVSKRTWIFLLLLCGAIAPYLGTLHYGFVYDDNFQLTLPAIRSGGAVPAYFYDPILGVTARYYRPIFFLWFRLNYFLWNTHAWGWHLTSVALHGAVSVLVLLICFRYFKDTSCAVVSALLFAVHPAHIETVAWISGCTDSLMSVGLLGSLLLWMKNQEAPALTRRIGSLFCCALALLSKEAAIVLPLLVGLHALAGIPATTRPEGSFGNRVRFAFAETAPYAGIAAAYLAVRWRVLAGIAGAPNWISLTQNLITVPSLVLFYLKHVFWPMDLSIFYDFLVIGRVSSYLFWLPILALAAIACGLWLWFRRRGDARIVIAGFWILLPIVPVLNIRALQLDDFAHDRYLYLSVLGFSILTGILYELLWKRGQELHAPLAAAGFLVIFLGLATAIQAQPWKDNLSLYEHAIRIAPENTVARHNLATEYAKAGRRQEASSMLKALLKDRPDIWEINYNYGCVNFQMGNLGVAEEYLKRAIHLDPSDPNQYLYLGMIYLNEERFAEAAWRVQQAVERNPSGSGYHYTLGLIELGQGNVAAARAEMQMELTYHPENAGSVRQAQQRFEPLKGP